MNYAELGVSAVVINAVISLDSLRTRRSVALQQLGGRPLLARALDVAIEFQPGRLIVVTGLDPHIAEFLSAQDLHVEVASSTAEVAGSLDGEVVLLDVSTPLLRSQTVAQSLRSHRQASSAVTFMANREQDVHPHVAVASAQAVGVLAASSPEDVVSALRGGGHAFSMFAPDDPREGGRVTSRAAFIELNQYVNRRTVDKWIDAGAMILDPATTWIHESVDLGVDVTILPNSHLEGATSVGDGATLGPDTTIRDAEIGPDAVVTRAHVELSVIGEGASVGPFAYVRPGTELGVKAKIGTFVETKNSHIGDGAKVPHLCYCGDGIIDEGANIGAGTIFANYDGKNKSKTHVGKNSFVGSNSVLVAPVDIADGAYVAAGSAVVHDVPAGALAVARGRQHNADDWVTTRKPHSKTAEAARAADGDVHPAVLADRDKLATQDAELKEHS